MKGNVSVRIKPVHSIDCYDDFDMIIGDINRITEELSDIETLRTDFIANVSHELKDGYGYLPPPVGPHLPPSRWRSMCRTGIFADRRHYAAYGLSAYALVISIIGGPGVLMGLARCLKANFADPVGTVSTLTMGLGMCCTMVWREVLFSLALPSEWRESPGSAPLIRYICVSRKSGVTSWLLKSCGRRMTG